MSTERIPAALSEAVGEDYQDGEAVWFWPEVQSPGFIDVMIWHEGQGRAALYTWKAANDSVTARFGNAS